MDVAGGNLSVEEEKFWPSHVAGGNLSLEEEKPRPSDVADEEPQSFRVIRCLNGVALPRAACDVARRAF